MIYSQINSNQLLLNTNIIEPFGLASNSKSVAKNVKTEKDKVLDSLHIDKYRNNYENIVHDTKTWADAQMLRAIVSDSVNTGDGLSSDNLKKISHINQLQSFKSCCDDALNLVDNN